MHGTWLCTDLAGSDKFQSSACGLWQLSIRCDTWCLQAQLTQPISPVTGPVNPFPTASERKLLTDPALTKKVTGDQPEQVG